MLKCQYVFRMMHEEASVPELVRGLYMIAVETEASVSVSVTKEMKTEGLRCNSRPEREWEETLEITRGRCCGVSSTIHTIGFLNDL